MAAGPEIYAEIINNTAYSGSGEGRFEKKLYITGARHGVAPAWDNSRKG